ncbi:MAG: hypothetical protein KBD21_04810 [Candidatus Pacebacteria bacterium]|nr:hypothetical protein [Candidatus Paceibacterota bacterium]
MVSRTLRFTSLAVGVIVFVGIIGMFPLFARADTTTTSTTVYASASTGGNTIVGGGTIIQGTPTSVLVVRSVENGAVVENLRIIKTDGSPILYKSKKVRVYAWAR